MTGSGLKSVTAHRSDANAPKEKALAEVPTRAFLLAYKDSNLDRQNQNLMCYRYTIGQTSKRFFEKQGKGITILHF